MPVGELATPTISNKDMPYVQFKTVTVEDPVRTRAEGRACYKDVDQVIVTVPGDTKGNSIDKVESFFEKKKQELMSGRILPEWLQRWQASYEAYKEGKEPPVNGTPILGWKLISGAQQQELIRMNVRSVEDLANLSDDGLRAVGMGASELKRRAQAWVAQNESHESGAVRLAELTKQNELLQIEVETMKKQLTDLLQAQAKGKKSAKDEA